MREGLGWAGASWRLVSAQWCQLSDALDICREIRTAGGKGQRSPPRGPPSSSSAQRVIYPTIASRRDAGVLYETGMQLAELAELDTSDLDLPDGSILVRNGKRRSATVCWNHTRPNR